jgi:hypothetical protein
LAWANKEAYKQATIHYNADKTPPLVLMSKTNKSVEDISDLDIFFWAAKCPALHFRGNWQGNTEICPRNQSFSHSKCGRVHVLGLIF